MVNRYPKIATRGKAMLLGMLVLGAALSIQPAFAQEATPSPSPSALPAAETPAQSEAQAQKLQALAANPIASLVSIPFQYNLNFNYGIYRRTQQLLNIQPVIPTDLGNGHTFVSRIVTPFIGLPALAPNVGPQIGVGDLNPQFYYVPKQGSVMVGYGPTFVFPTGTSQWVGQGKWSVGPDAVIVITQKNVVYGLLANNVWSVAGDPSRANVNQALFQAFSSWSLAHGLSVGVTSTTTANWEAAGSNKWNVPIGPTIFQLMKFGPGMGGQIGGAIFWTAVRPQYGSTWTARIQMTILQPAK
ncbi:MAG: neuromedin U [Candidatus Eremiobacteraeota bacterium]|nr:neuromedin U [Candidatus Eremiobacteraeota bacterium]